MLTSGVVPALFNDEEKDAIVGSCRNKAKYEGFNPSKFVIPLILFLCVRVFSKKKYYILGMVFGHTF